MYTKAVLYPYNLQSSSAANLAGALHAVRVCVNGTYRHRRGHLVINWGNSHIPTWGTPRAYEAMLNKPQQVAIASDKVRTFQRLTHLFPDDLPMWSCSREDAEGWLTRPIYGNKLNAVVCRTLTRANSGRGIILARTPAELVNAPLYTRYKPKRDEYRIHVSSRYGIIDSVRKLRRTGANGTDGFDPYIRSHNHGWIFARDNLVVPAAVAQAAERTIHVLGLDFGAVDIGYHPDFGLSIYEVNTAPGLEGTTLANYIAMFQRCLYE